MKVDLRKRPYYLEDEQIHWVEKTLSTLSVVDKISQLFTILTANKNEAYLREVTKKYKFGGVRYNPDTAQAIFHHNKIIQETASIPCLIAANTEAGGNGACKGGTEVGVGTKVGCTNDLQLAYELGNISAKEAKALGVNTLFAPIVDIHKDFHNPIIAYKTFGKDPVLVKNMSLAFLKGVQDNGLLACAKHFPGDGFDERDQHLSPSVNPLSKEDWDKSFGLVYESLISADIPMIMAGHIALPSYQAEEEKYLPATISKSLITDLLKDKLGFNGVVTTDATHMVALTCSMKRREYLPKIIAAGCDMILFYNDMEEDMEYMLEGYNQGIITEERLNDAVRRILGLKAKLKYDIIQPKDLFCEDDLQIVGCEEHKSIAHRVSQKGITLVKNTQAILPLKKDGRRILIVPHMDENPFEQFMPKGIPTIYDYIKEKLEQEGYKVELFESLMDKAKKSPKEEAFKIIQNIYNNKTPITSITDNYDLILHFCDFDSHNTTSRIVWKMSKGTPDIPWYVQEIPTIVISLRNPFHLFDVPQVKTYINAFDKNKDTMDVLIDKLLGKEEFLGISSVDAFCNDGYAKR